MWNLYTQLRGSDFTQATPSEERWAEDFRFFYGCDSIRGIKRSNDDGKRSPLGLSTFIGNFKYVLDYWRSNGAPSTASYEAEVWSWSKRIWWWTEYYYFANKTFYKWSKNQWIPFRTV
jgi:hypothetical protein